MKKVIFAGILSVFAIVSHGTADIWTNSFSTVVVNSQIGVKVTTGNVSVDLIDVMTAGSADSTIAIYDTSFSTSAPGVKKYEFWQGSSARVIPVAVDLSSGMFISNAGTTPAIVRFKIKRRTTL